MSLPATIVLTIGGSPLTFNRTGGDMTGSRYYYQTSLLRYDLSFRQGRQTLKTSTNQNQASRRANAELKTTVFATTTVPETVAMDYIVAVRPLADYSVAAMVGLFNALLAASNAVMTQLVAGET